MLLEKVTDINGLSLREKARYCLLWTESRDEAGLRHTSDSIISIATDYYRTTRGCYWPPKAWFYRGKVYEDMDQPSLALECYLRALEYEVVSEAISSVRYSAPLSADWKKRIDEDYKKREGRKHK